MKNSFYTNVAIRGENILYRGYENGKRIQTKVPYQPTVYIPTKNESEWKTLNGQPVEPFCAGGIYDTREFIKSYKNVHGFSVYGTTDIMYQYIGDEFPDEIDYDTSNIKIANIDIETTSESGFPSYANPIEQVIAITVDMGDKKHAFGLGDFHIDDESTICYCYQNEKDLLLDFLQLWDLEQPDIVTGWNIRFFDIPYLINRIKYIFPPRDENHNAANRLSPWRVIKERNVTRMNREHVVYELLGVATLDYYELYQTFTYTNQESYRLDHITFVELGEKKLSYEEYESMTDFHKNDFQKFMEYNVRDVELVTKLEEKLKLLELAINLAYSAKVNFMDVFSQVKTWDQIIYHYLKSKKIAIPPKFMMKKESQYEGAYVKEPIAGKHDWIVSYDLNSLYPHLIMQYNISPETMVDISEELKFGIEPNNILKGPDDSYGKTCYKNLETLKSKGYSVAANGTCYRKDKYGFLPELMETMYKERSMYKKKMIDCQKRQEAGEDGLENEIAKYNNFQLVRKIQLNSAYGAIGNQWFRYFDVRMAEAITLSGQLSIRWIADKLNEFLNSHVGSENYDYVVASDTDSVYLRLGNLVDKFIPKGSSNEKITNFLHKASEKIIQPFIDKQYAELMGRMNAYQNKMVMEREVIADKGVWTAKKRYMLNVYDSEGVRYENPKLKIMGIETTRSSTPKFVRDKLKKAIKLILTETESSVIKYIDEVKTEFFNQRPEDIAFPRGVSKLEKYVDSSTIYSKSTPIAVKGALIYNHYLKEKKLSKKYRLIQEGDKIKFLYLKQPNPMGGVYGRDHVISFNSMIPPEFGLDSYIDYELQFNKSFLEPLKNILEAIGWKHEETTTLESLFC